MSKIRSRVEPVSVVLLIIAIIISSVSYTYVARLSGKTEEMSNRMSGQFAELGTKVGALTSAEMELAKAVATLAEAVGKYGGEIAAIKERIGMLEEAVKKPKVEIPADIAAIVKTLPAYYPEDYWKIIKAAKEEGKLLIYSAMSGDFMERIIKAFNEQYPFIKVETWMGTSSKIFEKYHSEIKAGVPTADYITTGGFDMFLMQVATGNVLYYESPEQDYYSPEVHIRGLLYPPFAGTWSWAYNINMLPPEKVPKGFAHLVQLIKEDPAFWKDSIITKGHRLSSTAYDVDYLLYKVNGDKLLEWFKEIGKTGVDLVAFGGVITEKLTSGERKLALQSPLGTVIKAKVEKGIPVENLLPKEGTVIVYQGGSITKQARNPNAAKIWLDWVLSRKGQLEIATQYQTILRLDIKPEEVKYRYTSLKGLIEDIGIENLIFFKMEYQKELWDEKIRADMFVKLDVLEKP